MSCPLDSSKLVQLVKKDPTRVIEAFKLNEYDEAVFKDVHNAVMQMSTQSGEWKALQSANFYEFYQSVLFARDKYPISSPTWIQVAQLQVDYYKRGSSGSSTGPAEQMTLLIKRISESRDEILTMSEQGVQTIRRIDELDVIRNTTADLPMLLDISTRILLRALSADVDTKRLTALIPDPFKPNAVHLLQPVPGGQDARTIQAAFVRVLGMQRHTLSTTPYQKWIWLRLTSVTECANEWESMGDEALEILLDLVWETFGDHVRPGPQYCKSALDVLGRAVSKRPVPAHFFEKQGEHIFPLISRLVVHDANAFTTTNEKNIACRRFQQCIKVQMSRCPLLTKKKLAEQMMPIFLRVLFKLRSFTQAQTSNPQTQLAIDTLKTWTDIGADLGISQESALLDLKEKSGGLVGCSRVRCPLYGQTALGMMRCARCKKRQYCDERCQRRDWIEGKHKNECEEAPVYNRI